MPVLIHKFSENDSENTFKMFIQNRLVIGDQWSNGKVDRLLVTIDTLFPGHANPCLTWLSLNYQTILKVISLDTRLYNYL